MTDRERFAVKICNAAQKTNFACKEAKCVGKGLCAYCYTMADHLLANGVIVPPCKVGDMLINKKNGFIGEVDSIHIYRNGFPKITITDGMLDTTFAVFSLDWFEPLTKDLLNAF